MHTATTHRRGARAPEELPPHLAPAGSALRESRVCAAHHDSASARHHYSRLRSTSRLLPPRAPHRTSASWNIHPHLGILEYPSTSGSIPDRATYDASRISTPHRIRAAGYPHRIRDPGCKDIHPPGPGLHRKPRPTPQTQKDETRHGKIKVSYQGDIATQRNAGRDAMEVSPCVPVPVMEGPGSGFGMEGIGNRERRLAGPRCRPSHKVTRAHRGMKQAWATHPPAE
ncbi:hypothetical protein C8R44DRAFT_790189 [Mycena epipterygia]|nr:hypothetical protein C8R44DRAFT_790189 [Mycena epipterygia]